MECLRDSRQHQAAVLIQSLVRQRIAMKRWPTLKAFLKTKLANSKRMQCLEMEPIYEGSVMIQDPDFTIFLSGKVNILPSLTPSAFIVAKKK